jgi:hypothetical protein
MVHGLLLLLFRWPTPFPVQTVTAMLAAHVCTRLQAAGGRCPRFGTYTGDLTGGYILQVHLYITLDYTLGVASIIRSRHCDANPTTVSGTRRPGLQMRMKQQCSQDVHAAATRYACVLQTTVHGWANPLLEIYTYARCMAACYHVHTVKFPNHK